MLCAPAEQLPSSDSDESFDIEPALLIPYRPPGSNKMAEPEPEATPAPTVEKLTKDLERAKRNAISAERLYRMGALARVESEQKALRVVRIEAELEKARLNEVKDQTNQVEAEKSPTPNAQPSQASQLDSSKDAELAKAIEAAHAAAKKREEAELAAAEADLERQQKLLSLGSGHKSAVAKAARKLEELKAARN